MTAGDPSSDPLWIAECLCARLCHELAGSLGALMGSIELAREDEAMAKEAIAFAAVAGEGLVARLKLLRAAWAGEGMPLDLAHLAALARGLSDRRVTLDLSALPPSTMFDPATGRVVLNLVLLGAEALPGGGTVWLGAAGPDLVLGIAGPRPAWPPGLAAALAGETAIEGPRGLQAPLTILLARHHGLRLSPLLPPSGSLDPAGSPLLLLELPAESRFA